MSVAAPLPMTAYGVLGLLTFGAKSGYDLVKMVEATIGHFWTPARSQIYSELKRLSEHGYVTERRVKQEARPEKTIYSLTDEGRSALKDWLSDPAFEGDQIRSATMMKVFFGAHAPRDVLIARIKEVAARSEMTNAYLRSAESEIKDQEEWFFPYLTLQSGLLHSEASIRWAEMALELLEETEEP